MARSRAWCFTTFECTKESETLINSIDCVYIIVGDETCPSTDKKHWQGYLTFKHPQRFAGVQKMLPQGSHIEAAIASAIKNKAYCSKENILLEHGEIPMQGKRTDILRIRECLETGGNMRDVVCTATNLQGIRIGEKILEYTERKRDFAPTVKWFWGPTASGKTRAANVELPEAWWSGKDLKWWQGYDAHEDIIIDDFRGSFCTFHELLRILDRYPYSIEVKGGSRQLLAKNIIITSPYPPTKVYNKNPEEIGQLIRRIDVITEFETGTKVIDTEVGGNTVPPLPEIDQFEQMVHDLQNETEK